jgi:hypothetical protein
MTIIAECNGKAVGIRYVTVDHLGHIWDIVSMFDTRGHRTFDPLVASTCVILFHGEHIPQNADYVPIYTVH